MNDDDIMHEGRLFCLRVCVATCFAFLLGGDRLLVSICNPFSLFWSIDKIPGLPEQLTRIVAIWSVRLP